MSMINDTGRDTIRYATGRCWLGGILVASSASGVCAILLGDDTDALARDLRQRFPDADVIEDGGDAARHLADAIDLVEAPTRPVVLPLDPRGTAFQQRVWEALREIPAGSTASYGDVARRLGEPRMAREVAEACAANALAVAIPCHRVVKTGGAISGYRWGVRRKRALLQREAA